MSFSYFKKNNVTMKSTEVRIKSSVEKTWGLESRQVKPESQL